MERRFNAGDAALFGGYDVFSSVVVRKLVGGTRNSDEYSGGPAVTDGRLCFHVSGHFDCHTFC